MTTPDQLVLTPARRAAWALAVVFCALVPSALAAFLILWVMPQTVLQSPGSASVLDSVLPYSAVSVAVVVAVLAHQLFRRRGPGRRSSEEPFTAWLVVKSCVLTFGWSAAAAFMPWGVMGEVLQGVLPEDTVPLGATATGILVLIGFLALLVGTMMALVDYGRPREA